MDSQKPRIREVIIRYYDASDIIISGQEIERMVKAADALEMIHNAKQIAERLSRL